MKEQVQAAECATDGVINRRAPVARSGAGIARRPRAGPAALALADGRWLFGLLICMIVLTGGTNPYYPYLRGACELAGCGLIAATALSRRTIKQPWAMPDWLAAGVLVLMLVQLVPLPPELWTHLPGREFALGVDMAVYGHPIWRPLSLDPEATLRSMTALLPALGAYIAVRTGDALRRHAMLCGLALAAAINIAIAFLQRAAGPENFAHFFTHGDTGFAVGLFTNHNHLASFLACALPLVLLAADGGWSRFARLAVALSASALVAVTIVLTGSRGGLAVFPFALLGISAALAARHSGLKRMIGIVMAFALLMAAMFALFASGVIDIPALSRSRALIDDQRLDFWPAIPPMIAIFFPAGSGFGTFASTYALHEPLDLVGQKFINHAHNDYLEITLESGLAGLAMIAAFIAWFARAAWRAAERASAEVKAGTGLHAASVIVMVLLHSLVDYPLRTGAVSATAAIAVALLLDSGLKRVAAR